MSRFDGAVDLAEIATPTTNPDSGRRKFYIKSNGIPYILDSSGQETSGQGTRWGFTTTWAFADTTNVDCTMADSGKPRVGDLVISTNGFSYGAVHRITAVYGTGPWTIDIDGTTLYVMNGVDTGWQSPSFASGWADYGGGFHTCQYRRINDMLYLKGLLKRTGANVGSLTTIYTLPSGSRPVGACAMSSWGSPTGSGEGGMTIYVTAAGLVQCSSHAINTNGYLYMNVVVPAVA